MFIVFAVIVSLFAFVILFGAPYLPTRRAQTQAALDLLNLKPGQTLFELGCGDGRVLKQAAQRGLLVVGYELNPILVLTAWLYTWKYRKQVRIIWGNFWKADLSRADGVFVFLLDRFMVKLDEKLKAEVHGSTKLVSFAFKIPHKKAKRSKAGIYLYEY
ncbi:MAG: class I SAM-dependent methyltransferase [Candidatus Saccharimonadales bacterium]